VQSAVAEATVFVAGVGYFELTANGQRVGQGRKYDVGWTQYVASLPLAAPSPSPSPIPVLHTSTAAFFNFSIPLDHQWVQSSLAAACCFALAPIQPILFLFPCPLFAAHALFVVTFLRSSTMTTQCCMDNIDACILFIGTLPSQPPQPLRPVAWPSCTRYAKRINYIAFDLAPYLVVGNNTLGVELGNSYFNLDGWYQLPPYTFRGAGGEEMVGCRTKPTPDSHGRNWPSSGTCNGGGFSYNTTNQLLLSARVRLAAGGDILHVNSGPGWHAGAGPITFNSVYDGEWYDARLEQPGWDTPMFVPTAGAVWTAAPQVPDSTNVLANATLSSQLYEPIKV